MAIERYCDHPEGNITITCDGEKCKETLPTGTSNFRDAIKQMFDRGWKNKQLSDGDYVHLCFGCKTQY